MPTESDLYEQIARYLNLRYPQVVYHFDLAGVHNPSPSTRALYGRLNRRAWPDLFIAEPVLMPGKPSKRKAYQGLFLELKRAGTRLKTRDGRWASPHIAEQAAMLADLQDKGYIAQFACGFVETQEIIDSYFQGMNSRGPLNAKELSQVFDADPDGEVF